MRVCTFEIVYTYKVRINLSIRMMGLVTAVEGLYHCTNIGEMKGRGRMKGMKEKFLRLWNFSIKNKKRKKLLPVIQQNNVDKILYTYSISFKATHQCKCFTALREEEWANSYKEGKPGLLSSLRVVAYAIHTKDYTEYTVTPNL